MAPLPADGEPMGPIMLALVADVIAEGVASPRRRHTSTTRYKKLRQLNAVFTETSAHTSEEIGALLNEKQSRERSSLLFS